MAINLNHSIFGKQFAAFADFARLNEGNPDTLVCMGGNENPLEPWDRDKNPRRIVAKTDGDSIRSRTNLFYRHNDKASVNDEVRRIFKDTILSVCNVDKIEDLPESIRDVMNKQDYGKGRPLSVRRIKAVTDAVTACAKMQEDNIRESRLDADYNVSVNSDSFQNAGEPKIKDIPVDEPKEEIDLEEASKPVESLRVRIGSGRGNIQPISQNVLSAKVKSLYGGIPGHGDLVSAVAIETIKAVDGRIAENELEKIDYDECEQLFNSTEAIDLSRDLESMTSDPQDISNALNRIRRKASNMFDEIFPEDGSSGLMREIKRNLFLNFALLRVNALGAYGMDIKRVNRFLVSQHGQGEMLDLIAPAFLRQNAGFDIRKR